MRSSRLSSEAPNRLTRSQRRRRTGDGERLNRRHLWLRVKPLVDRTKTRNHTRRNESFMPNTIHCPQCNRELRVPDELLGKKVKCPACSTTFTASIAASEAEPPPLTPVGSEPARLQPAPDESPDAARGFQEDYQRPSGPPRDRSRGLAVMRAPAICLLDRKSVV